MNTAAVKEGSEESDASAFCAVFAEGYALQGLSKTFTDVVQRESEVTIRVDGHQVCTLCCSADHLMELVVGHLITQHIVRSRKDIKQIALDGQSRTVSVTLKDAEQSLSADLATAPRVSSSSAYLFAEEDRSTCRFNDVIWTESWVYAVAREFAKDKTSHARTRGCHSAYLAKEGRVLCMREDIGRHNAFDKVVGWAVLRDIDLTQCMLYTSGRVPADMVSKALCARIPVLASKSVTTDRAIERAQAAGLVLLCEALPESFALMSGNGPQIEGKWPQSNSTVSA